MGDIMVLAIGSIVGAIFRFISAMLDTVVYWALTCVYNLLSDIASVNLFGSDGAGEFATRIYTIIGVIMLFKLAFSILTYIIDPDKMTDNKNGFGTIVKDIVIMFVLIVTVPLIFRTAMGLQYLILEDDTIGRLVTGHHGGDYKSMGDRLSSNILMTFIHPNESYFPDCNGVMSKESENYQKCVDSLAPYSDVKAQFEQVYDDETFGRQHILALGMKTNKVNGHSDEFVITYHIFLSTIVGGFAAYILLIFCIDIATRTIKMAFLQLIAPIPIVAYMDEKGKNGMFKKWVTVCRNTYADLFIRLAGIDFAIYLIAEFIYNNQAKICNWKLEGTTLSSFNCTTPGPFVTLFMVLGVLVFAKQLPSIIKEITGIDLNGKFTMNPLKKIQDEALFGKQVASGLGLAGRTAGNLALAGGAIAGAQMMKNRHIAGVVNGITGFGHRVGGIVGGAGGAVGNYLTGTAGGRYFNRISNDAQRTLGGLTQGRTNARIKEMESVQSEIDSMLKRANGEMIKYENMAFNDTNGNATTMRDFKIGKERLAALSNMDTTKWQNDMVNQQLTAQERADARSAFENHLAEVNDLKTYINKTEKLAEQAYVDQIRAGTLEKVDSNGNVVHDANGNVVYIEDSEITSRANNVELIIRSSSTDSVRNIDTTTGKGLKEGKDNLTAEIANQKGSGRFRGAQ